MKGRVVIVTGADGGLGKSVTQALLDSGATVVGTSRKMQTTESQHPLFLEFLRISPIVRDPRG
jgi:NAD(P)-dependent dehydrogenase (short-subunit alcohol dehydrogenase family)